MIQINPIYDKKSLIGKMLNGKIEQTINFIKLMNNGQYMMAMPHHFIL